MNEKRVKVLPVLQGGVEPPGYLKPEKWIDIQIDKLDWVIEKLRRDIDSYMRERYPLA